MKKQHKLLLLFFILTSFFKSYSQEYEVNLSPEGKLETIYPNPSKGIYNIDLSQVKEPSTITIYNILGELVYSQLLAPQTENQIDISDLANGYYIARIKNESLDTNRKLIKN